MAKCDADCYHRACIHDCIGHDVCKPDVLCQDMLYQLYRPRVMQLCTGVVQCTITHTTCSSAYGYDVLHCHVATGMSCLLYTIQCEQGTLVGYSMIYHAYHWRSCIDRTCLEVYEAGIHVDRHRPAQTCEGDPHVGQSQLFVLGSPENMTGYLRQRWTQPRGPVPPPFCKLLAPQHKCTCTCVIGVSLHRPVECLSLTQRSRQAP